jgi:hypothetical protein
MSTKSEENDNFTQTSLSDLSDDDNNTSDSEEELTTHLFNSHIEDDVTQIGNQLSLITVPTIDLSQHINSRLTPKSSVEFTAMVDQFNDMYNMTKKQNELTSILLQSNIEMKNRLGALETKTDKIQEDTIATRRSTENIKKDTSQIKEDTGKIKEDTGAIKGKVDTIDKTTAALKEKIQDINRVIRKRFAGMMSKLNADAELIKKEGCIEQFDTSNKKEMVKTILRCLLAFIIICMWVTKEGIEWILAIEEKFALFMDPILGSIQPGFDPSKIFRTGIYGFNGLMLITTINVIGSFFGFPKVGKEAAIGFWKIMVEAFRLGIEVLIWSALNNPLTDVGHDILKETGIIDLYNYIISVLKRFWKVVEYINNIPTTEDMMESASDTIGKLKFWGGRKSAKSRKSTKSKKARKTRRARKTRVKMGGDPADILKEIEQKYDSIIAIIDSDKSKQLLSNYNRFMTMLPSMLENPTQKMIDHVYSNRQVIMKNQKYLWDIMNPVPLIQTAPTSGKK